MKRWTKFLAGLVLLTGLISWPIPHAVAAGGPIFISALDMSGSTNSSDPERYTVSAVAMRGEALAPAQHSLLLFAGELEDSKAIQPAGPYDLDSKDGVAAFRSQIGSMHDRKREGNTPLSQVVRQAKEAFLMAGAPAGSELAIFTDGEPAPDPEKQLSAIEAEIPVFKQHGWRISVVTLGTSNEQWAKDLQRLVTETNGQFDRAANTREVSVLFLKQLASMQKLPSPTVTEKILPGNGQERHSFTLDASIKEAIILVTRQTGDVKVEVVRPDGKVLDPKDPRVRLADYDPHFVLIQLRDTAPLGAGEWTVRLSGPPHAYASVATVYRSRMGVELEHPGQGEMIQAGSDYRVVARVVDDGKLLTQSGASLRLEVKNLSDGTVSPFVLLDDGKNGDEARGDGRYSAIVKLNEGSYDWELLGTHQATAIPSQRGSFVVDNFPELLSEPPVDLPPVTEGSEVAIPLARLTVGGADVKPDVVSSLSVTVTNQQNKPVADAKAVFENGKLIVKFTPRRGDGLVKDDGYGGLEQAIYTVEVRMSGNYRGKTYAAAPFKTQVRTTIQLKEGWTHVVGRYWGYVVRFIARYAWVFAGLIAVGAIYLLFLWGRRRIGRKLRFRGVLIASGNGRVIDLASAMTYVTILHRLIRMQIDLGRLDTVLAGLQVQAAPDKSMYIRFAGKGPEAQLNDRPLGRRWRPLLPGAILALQDGRLQLRYDDAPGHSGVSGPVGRLGGSGGGWGSGTGGGWGSGSSGGWGSGSSGGWSGGSSGGWGSGSSGGWSGGSGGGWGTGTGGGWGGGKGGSSGGGWGGGSSGSSRR